MRHMVPCGVFLGDEYGAGHDHLTTAGTRASTATGTATQAHRPTPVHKQTEPPTFFAATAMTSTPDPAKRMVASALAPDALRDATKEDMTQATATSSGTPRNKASAAMVGTERSLANTTWSQGRGGDVRGGGEMETGQTKTRHIHRAARGGDGHNAQAGHDSTHGCQQRETRGVGLVPWMTRGRVPGGVGAANSLCPHAHKRTMTQWGFGSLVDMWMVFGEAPLQR